MIVKWEKLLKKIKDDCAIDSEGNNLSGLPDEVPEIVSVVLSMAKDISNMENLKLSSSIKAKARERSMLTHESSVSDLRTSSDHSTSNSTSDGSPPRSEQSESSVSSDGGSSKYNKSPFFETFSATILSELQKDSVLEMEARRQKDRREEELHNAKLQALKAQTEVQNATLKLILESLRK